MDFARRFARHPTASTGVRALLARHLPLVAAAAGFSAFVNVLTLAAPLYMLQVYDRVLTSRSIETLVLLALITLAAQAAGTGLDSIRSQLLARVAVRIETEGAAPVLGRTLERSSIAPADRQGLRDLRALRQFVSSHAGIALLDAPWCPIFVALITLVHPLLGAITASGVATLLGLAWLDDRLSRRSVEAAADASRRIGEASDEAIANADAVRALGLRAALEQRVRSAGTDAAAAALAAARASGRVLAVSKLLRQGLQVVMLGVGAALVIRQEASPGAMIATTLLLGRALAPIESVIAGWKLIVEARAALRRLTAALADGDPAAPMPLPAPQGALATERVIVARDDGRPILKGVSFALEPGEQLGLVGPSGAGKSVLGRVLVGALQPSGGAVRLDGAELSQWDRDALGARLGYLPPDVQLFDGTVATNIGRFADPAQAHEAIVAAARQAGIHDWILQLPQGYDTPIGPRGLALSSGQRQLVGLARALYGQPALVVLDEPNANLDSDGEERLLAALRALKERRTTVVLITHRPSLLRDADQVLVLRAGAVAELGERDAVLGRVARVTPITPMPVQPRTAIAAG